MKGEGGGRGCGEEGTLPSPCRKAEEETGSSGNGHKDGKIMGKK